ncbi:hypothetical protein L218DRAFT_1008637 [Marasmius fiardii PR-910]|nr:hypothetical protein L218DRAFT_1008637 [Marasmius fiardii PR-910]
MEFWEPVERRFNEKMSVYEEDHAEWARMMERLRAAEKHGFRPVSISELRMIMTTKGTGAIILIPENTTFAQLLVTYREPDGNGLHCGNETEFVYADELAQRDLLGLDGNTESAGAFWYEERWRYVGDVRKGDRYGVGTITYADASVYREAWFQGKRDGFGESSPAMNSAGKKILAVKKGVFVDNDFVSDRVVVQVRVYRGESLIRFERVALWKGSVTFTHIEKIGRVMGWRLGDKYKLKIDSKKLLEIIVNGTRVDPSER